MGFPIVYNPKCPFNIGTMPARFCPRRLKCCQHERIRPDSVVPLRQLRKNLFSQTRYFKNPCINRVFRSNVCGLAEFFEVPLRVEKWRLVCYNSKCNLTICLVPAPNGRILATPG